MANDYITYKGKQIRFRSKNYFRLGQAELKDILELQDLFRFKNLDYLQLNNNEITEIKGLEHFPNLVFLDLHENKISKISNLDTATKLRKLELQHNKVERIEGISQLTNLEILDLSYNQIKKIENLDSLKNLKELNLAFNEISKIENLDELINLEILTLSGNQNITKIENLDSLTNLKNLVLKDCKINKIEGLSNLKNLESLNLSSNQQISKIENLDLLPKLKSLYLYDLSIERIEGLDALTSLESLGITSNVKQYLDIEGLANLKNLKELQIEQFKLFNNDSVWFERSIKAFRFISMIKQNNYLEIEDWKQVFKDARWVFGDDFLCNNSKYQQKWLYDQCTPKILDILEKILNEPEFEDIRRGYERQWEDLLEEAKKYLFQPPKILIDYTERRRMASEKSGGREFCIYVKRPDYQIAYIGMAYLIEDLIKENIIPNINPYDMETSEELELHELKYYTSLTHIDDFSIRLTPTEEFELFFENEMQYVGKLKLKLKLFNTDEDLLDRIGTPLGTNFFILSIPFSQEIWSDYALKDIIQDENDYYGFYRTKACQIFEKKYEKFLDSLKGTTGDEIGTGFYLKKRKKTHGIRLTDLIFGKD